MNNAPSWCACSTEATAPVCTCGHARSEHTPLDWALACIAKMPGPCELQEVRWESELSRRTMRPLCQCRSYTCSVCVLEHDIDDEDQ